MAGVEGTALSLLTKGIYAGSVGLSAKGNAYNWAMSQPDLNYTKQQARTYANLVGASEALLSYFLNGVGKYTGAVTESWIGALTSKIANIDNVLIRASLTMGGKLLAKTGGEAIEESLQAVIEPLLAEQILNIENTTTSQDVLYAGLMASITALLFGGGDKNLDLNEDMNFDSGMQGYIQGGEIDFFDGVEDLDALRNRRNELAKIYNTDNGTNPNLDIFQTVNRQYDMKKAYYQSLGAAIQSLNEKAQGKIGQAEELLALPAANEDANAVRNVLSAMDPETVTVVAQLFNTDASRKVLGELNTGKRPSIELLEQLADETGLAKRALDVSQAFQSEQSALSDLRQAQARYGSENTPQARSALTSAQAAYEGAVSTLEKAAYALGINSEEGMQNLRDTLSGTETEIGVDSAESTESGNGTEQSPEYGGESPSGLTLPGAELFAQENASTYESVEPTLTLPGEEILNAAYQSELSTVAAQSAQTQSQLAAQYNQVKGTLESLNVGDTLVSPATGETAYTVTVRTRQGITLEGSAGEINIPNGTMPVNGQELAMQLINGTLVASNQASAASSTSATIPVSNTPVDINPQNGSMGRGGQSETGIDNYNLDTFKYFKYEQLKTEPDTAYFWSGKSNGVGGPENAAEIAIKNGGVTLETILESQGIKLPEYNINDPVSVEAWQNASIAYARQASGVVRALIGAIVNPKGIWNSYELPNLKDNKRVTTIILIDPETKVETMIFTR